MHSMGEICCQNREHPKAVGDEYDVLSCTDVIRSEKKRHKELGKYVESITHSISTQNKKIIYFNSSLWGL